MARDSGRWPEVVEFLKKNRGKFTYGKVAASIGSGASAVGQMMKAICSRELHQYCPRVVDAKTGMPRHDCPGNSK